MTQQANLAYYYVSGPVHIYCRIPSVGAGPARPINGLGGQIFFLGHCKVAPEPASQPQYIPAMSALAGPVIPDDEIYAGQKTELNLEMTRFNFTLLNALASYPMYGRGAPPGIETYLDRGRLVQAQGDSYELWVVNSFYGTPNANAYPDLPIGYYYPCVRTHENSPKNQSRDATIGMLHCTPLSVRQGITGGFITYLQDPQYFLNLPLPG